MRGFSDRFKSQYPNTAVHAGLQICDNIIIVNSPYILLNIKFSGFDFKALDYTVDRYIIDSVTGYNTDKYLVFRNDRITV